MKQFTKKYQVWSSADNAYTFKEFDTLQECIAAEKYSDWYITKRVSLSVTDAEEPKLITPTIPYVQPRADESKPDPAEELAARYAGGAIGTIKN